MQQLRNNKNRTNARPMTFGYSCYLTRQGWQFWNQTFDEDDWDFDVEEIREMLDG